jgi:hypothetical protein
MSVTGKRISKTLSAKTYMPKYQMGHKTKSQVECKPKTRTVACTASILVE